MLVFFTILINIGISILDLNVTSLFSEMFITFEDRIKANSILLTLGIIFGLFLDLANFRTYLIIMNDRIIVSIIGIILLALSIVLGFVFYNNGINEKEIHLNDSKTPIKEMIKMPLKNRDFLLFLALNIIIPLGLYYSLRVNTSIYTNKISIFNGNFWDYLLTIIQTSSLIFFIFIWRKRTETNDIKKNLKIGIIFIILSSLPLTFLSPFLYFVSLILNSIGRAAYILFNFIFLSFLIDNNEIKTKSRHDATFFGIRNAISLIGSLLPLILSYFFLFLFGSGYDPYSEFTIEIFLQTTLMYILIALISLISGLLILKYFSYNSKRINEIESELNLIHEEKRKQL
jgi:Na+/melibiose symporter-like transporter